MPIPTADTLIVQCQTILEGLQIPNELGVLEARKYAVFPEWIESFDNGENPDALRSDLDLYDDEINGAPIQRPRVNAWLIEENKFSQYIAPATQSWSLSEPEPQAAGVSSVSFNLRLFFFYQYGGLGAPHVRRVIHAARRKFNGLPKLGFAQETAKYIEGHDGLQIPLMTEGDFNGTICYVRGCQLNVRVCEPIAEN